MSTPSLLNIPYLYKAGTLYSQIPESGAGDFTVSRTTTVANRSTRINKDGFIETVLDNVPRLDYPLGGAVNGCPALLVEPSATNLVPSGTTYTALAGALASTVTDSPAVAISGTLCTKNEASGNLRYIRQSVSTVALVSGTTYTLSRFFKYNGVAFNTTLEAEASTQWGGVAFKQVVVLSAASGVTIGTSTACTGSVENFGNGWYRVNVRVTTGATIGGTANVTILSELPSALSTGQGFLTACPQLEVGSVATSYIPTTTAAVTRSADVIRKTGITSLIGQSEGTAYFEFEVTAEARTRWVATIDSGNNDFIQFFINSSRVLGVSINKAGATVMTTLSSSALSVGYHKVAFAYNTATNGCEMFIDGVQNPVASRTITGAGLPALSNSTLGSFTTSNSDSLKGRIRAAALYPNRLSNAQLEYLTSFASYEEMALALSYTLI